ncbi:Tissue inhibitor of metalloproteinase [Paenibacillus sp. OV219]|nr:Tissue inhibitor of metalloproteinase [Paenibacillus sp. OV219]
MKGELDRKTAIFEGTVLEIKQPSQKTIMSTADKVRVTFEVSRVWKGEVGQQAEVYTAMSSASCGIENFEVGTKYIVSAYKDSKPLETNICDLTKPLANARAELAILGDGYAPMDQASNESGNLMVITLIVTITAIIIGLFVWMIVKRPRV